MESFLNNYDDNISTVTITTKDISRAYLKKAIDTAIKEGIKDNSVFILKAIKLLMKLG